MSKPVMSVSFSGGRTSAYMARWLLDNKADEYDLIFTFANTGREREETLEYVHECDQRWGLNVVWLEAVVHHGEKKGNTHRIVDFKTASRNGEPFEETIKKYGVPNMGFPHCTMHLKEKVMDSYKKSLGLKKPLTAIGIRIDEADRCNSKAEKLNLCYPLVHWHPTTKQQVLEFWARQPFDLGLKYEYMGNCDCCWKKSHRKLLTVAQTEPEKFLWWAEMEDKYSRFAHPHQQARHDIVTRGDQILFFRGNRKAWSIVQEASEGNFNPATDDPVTFSEFDEYYDVAGGCGESCEVYSDGDNT